MRDATVFEKAKLSGGRCPFCGGAKFNEGPHGGMAINWYCAKKTCQAGFNIAVIPGAGLWQAEVIREPISPELYDSSNPADE